MKNKGVDNMEKSKKTSIWFWVCLIVAMVVLEAVLLITATNHAVTGLIDMTNEKCRGKSFSSVSDALKGMEDEVDPDDNSLDYSPPYNLLASFDYDEFIVVMYSYEEATPNCCAIRMLRKNNDGTLSFVGGFTDFYFNKPSSSNPNYYYYCHINTSRGVKTISFLYLPSDDSSDLYVDGVKAEKTKVNVNGEEFYVCAAISRRDTFLKNMFVPIANRHTITIK